MTVTGAPASIIAICADVRSGSLKAQTGRLATTVNGMGVALGSTVGCSVAVGIDVTVAVGGGVRVGAAVAVGVVVAVGVWVVVGVEVHVAVGDGSPKAMGSNAKVNCR